MDLKVKALLVICSHTSVFKSVFHNFSKNFECFTCNLSLYLFFIDIVKWKHWYRLISGTLRGKIITSNPEYCSFASKQSKHENFPTPCSIFKHLSLGIIKVLFYILNKFENVMKFQIILSTYQLQTWVMHLNCRNSLLILCYCAFAYYDPSTFRTNILQQLCKVRSTATTKHIYVWLFWLF